MIFIAYIAGIMVTFSMFLEHGDDGTIEFEVYVADHNRELMFFED